MKDTYKDIPLDFFQRNLLLPLEADKVAVCDETPFEALEDLRLVSGKNFKPILITKEEIDEGLRNLLVEDIEKSRAAEEEPLVIAEDETQDLLTQTKDAPIIKLVNSFFLKAVSNRASDIHLEPYETEARARMRTDGVLHEIMSLPKIQYQAVVARIKVMSKLNLAERRLPQDGRLRVKAGNSIIDVRVATIPTLFGERVVLRLLDKTMQILTLEQLGMEAEYLKRTRHLISHPYGLVLVTGPTGSGKSTTLYAALLEVRSPFKNIITIEDPVEYQIQGIGQIPVNPKIGLTFANGLRSIVRQDPDIIMVGEIRDSETADIAIHAALTGHLVLSTLHTNDAPTAVSRLVDMGVESFLISSSLRGAIAQRLVRKLCECKKSYKPAYEEIKELGLDPDKMKNHLFYKASGCSKCLNTGFKGRTAIFEIMVIDEKLQHQITQSSDSVIIRKQAREQGMLTLLEDGARKVLDGITTTEEILRATMA